MSTLNGQWIELFRAGDYGDKGAYTESDIDQMVASYDPAKHEAPVVIGHPEHNAPAYGWVEALRRVGSVLMGKLKQVQPQFEELVRKGLFKKRSISFYVTPSGPALRHVGFLGAMPPEVKGLADVKLASFSAGAFQAIDFKEDDVDGTEISRSITQSLKEFFSELFKGKKVVELSDADQAKALETAMAAVIKPLQDQHTKLQQEFAEYKKTVETSAATHSQTTFAEKQVQRVKDAKRWIPAFDKMGLSQIFGELAKATAKVSFGEGDKKVEKLPAEAFADFMIGLGEIVPMGELVRAEARRSGKLVQFTEPSRGEIDQQSVSLAEAAMKLSKDKNISYGDALRQVRRSGEYNDAGSSAAGSV
jgi:hypothetical protein